MFLLRSRRVLIGIAAVAAVLLVTLWVLHLGDRPDQPHLLDETALAALPDAQLEQRLVNDLAQRLAYAGYSLGAWHRFTEEARSLWAISSIEEEALDFGFGRLATVVPGADQAPALADARDAYRAMGLTEAADAIDQAMGGGGDRARNAFTAAVRKPELRAKRASWVRAHLAALASP